MSDIAEFAPGELYTDQYKVKVNDLVSRYDLDRIPLILYSVSRSRTKGY